MARDPSPAQRTVMEVNTETTGILFSKYIIKSPKANAIKADNLFHLSFVVIQLPRANPTTIFARYVPNVRSGIITPIRGIPIIVIKRIIKAGTTAIVIKNPIPKLFQKDFVTKSAEPVRCFLKNLR